MSIDSDCEKDNHERHEIDEKYGRIEVGDAPSVRDVDHGSSVQIPLSFVYIRVIRGLIVFSLSTYYSPRNSQIFPPAGLW